MTSPISAAQSLAKSPAPKDQALAIAIVTRSLTDDTEERAGWPLDLTTAFAAAKYLDLDPRAARLSGRLDRALALAPTLSDAILNKASAR